MEGRMRIGLGPVGLIGRLLAGGVLVALLLPVPVLAATVDCNPSCSLADLATGEDSFTVGDLTFSNFDVIATGVLTQVPLGEILVMPLLDMPRGTSAFDFGFDLAGGLQASDGESGNLLIFFDIDSTTPLLSATLFFDGGAGGPGAGASVTETFLGINEQAFVFSTGGGASRLQDVHQFSSQPTSLSVIKDIILDSHTLSGESGTADIGFVRQQFAVVPEPSTGLLVLLGLGGAFWVRRRLS